MQTIRMTGSRKFADLQAFPLDPSDYTMLKQRVVPDKVTFYLRLFFDDHFRTVVVIDQPSNLARMWRLLEQQNNGAVLDEGVLAVLVERVYEAFAEPPIQEKIDAGKIALKMLCLHYQPGLRKLVAAPRENVVGVIMQFKARRIAEYCYVQFAVDDVPGLTARFH